MRGQLEGNGNQEGALASDNHPSAKLDDLKEQEQQTHWKPSSTGKQPILAS